MFSVGLCEMTGDIFLKNCKILNEQGKFIDASIALNESKHIVEENLISIEQDFNFHKKFYEEIYPICYLAKYLEAQDIRLTNDTKEHLSYDAVIKFKNGVEQLVECTTAMDGQQDHLRNEHLKKYGYAPCRATICFEGIKRNRQIKPKERFSCMLGSSVRDEILSSIEKAFINKRKKNRPSYKDAVLLIVVDCAGTNISKLSAFLKERCSIIFSNKQPFKKIFLIHKSPEKYEDLFMEF